jgi:hypothetical protein
MDVDAALQSLIRKIEATYGKPLGHWFAVIDTSGLTKHTEVVALLKTNHGFAHGAAHRVSLLARHRQAVGVTAPSDPADALYADAKPDSGRCTTPSLRRSARLAGSNRRPSAFQKALPIQAGPEQYA